MSVDSVTVELLPCVSCESGCQLGWVPNRLAPEPPWSSGWGHLGGCQLAWEEAVRGRKGKWIYFLYFLEEGG